MLSVFAAMALTAAAPGERVVYLIPLGKVEPRLVEVARDAIAARINATFRIAEARDLPEAAYYKPCQRY
jgi:hypothetical protein